jgi:hypothetical protein
MMNTETSPLKSRAYPRWNSERISRYAERRAPPATKFDYIQTPDVEGYHRNYRELGARNIDEFLAGRLPLARR